MACMAITVLVIPKANLGNSHYDYANVILGMTRQ